MKKLTAQPLNRTKFLMRYNKLRQISKHGNKNWCQPVKFYLEARKDVKVLIGSGELELTVAR